MKKIFTFLLLAVSVLTAAAQNSKVLYENADAPMLSWSVVCSVSADDVKGIKAGDYFEVTVAEKKTGTDWPKFGFENGSESNYPTAFEMWGDKTFPYVAKYIVTEADIDLLKNGFDIKGDGVRITKVEYVQTKSENLPEGQTLIFNDENAPMLSWGVACTVTAAQVEGIQAGDTFEVTVAERKAGTDWPKFGFENGSESNYPTAFEMWGDKTFPYVAKYIVTEADIDLLKNGFDIKGDGVRITRVVFNKTKKEELPEGQKMIYNNPDATMLSWSVLCSVTASQVEGLKAGDAFIATVEEIKEGEEWPKFGIVKGSNEIYPEEYEMWGEKTFPYEATYYVTAENVEWMKNGFDIKGNGVRITRIIMVTAGEADTEIVLWKGEPTTVSWGAGPTVAAGKAAQIEASDVLQITVDEIVTGAGKWPKVVCRCEDGWDEIFTLELYGDEYKDATLPIVVDVPVTAAMIEALHKGFNFGGENVAISKVALKKGMGGVDDIFAETAEPETVSVYTVTGICVRHNVKAENATEGLPAGLYIMNGKKYLVR